MSDLEAMLAKISDPDERDLVRSWAKRETNKMRLAVSLVVLGSVAVIGGIAVIYWPAAVIALGALVLASVLLISFDDTPPNLGARKLGPVDPGDL